jgi:hypothetical protein
MRRWLVNAAVVGAIAVSVPMARAEEGTELVVSAGAYDIAKTRSTEAGLEYRLRSRAWELVPVLGISATEDGAFWAYGGLRRSFRLGRGWRLTPGFAVSLYEEGSTGKDLGGPLEFRTSVELSHRFARGSSLGLAVYHLSNASIYDDNPGSNSLIVTWALPVSGPQGGSAD